MMHELANFKFAVYVGDKQTMWNPGPQARQYVYIYPSTGLLPCYVISPTKIEWHFEIFLIRASVTCIKFIKRPTCSTYLYYSTYHLAYGLLNKMYKVAFY
jgi:hypothetical protein